MSQLASLTKTTALLFFAAICLNGFSQTARPIATKAQLEYCKTQVDKTLAYLPETAENLPRHIETGKAEWSYTGFKSWVSGFYPGVLWQIYEYTGDEKYKVIADRFSQKLAPLSRMKASDHDLGFQMYCSFGNGLRLTGEQSYKQILLASADTLATLFNPKVGTILSWPRKVPEMMWPQHNTIMDNMMNLELLFWAAKNGGSKKLYDIAVSHAKTTMQNAFRPDYTSYHVVIYDTLTGKKIKGVTHQGLHDTSMWARGQAWGIYGFTMVYRETKDPAFLKTATGAADVFLARLPSDMIPYWDFSAPASPETPRDASAAAITASALLELSTHVKEKLKSKFYRDKAEAILAALSSGNYQSRSVNSAFLLHSTGHKPNGTQIDYSLNYADYYYIEALLRLKKLQEGKEITAVLPVKKNSLWYSQPAKNWVEALPLGNGRLGAMVFGGVEEELIQLNESTLWSGGPVKTNVNPDAFANLAKTREALAKEDFELANSLTKKMQGLYSQSYLPLGDMIIKQDLKGIKPTAYNRELNLEDALATTTYTVDGVSYKRELFISAPSQAMIVKITSSAKNAISVKVSSHSQLRHVNSTVSNNQLILSGKAPANVYPNYYKPAGVEPIIYEDSANCYGMRFQVRIKALTNGGEVSVDTSGLQVRNANELILVIAAATSFNGFDKCPDKEGKDEKAIADLTIVKAVMEGYDALLKNHKSDFRKYFSRLKFEVKDTLGYNPNAQLPSDVRLKNYSANKAYDPGLEALYFQYGRYLLISSSRPGGPPANLQGVWNKELRAPWSSNYTININTQMNYWPAEVSNLSEMHQPLLDWIQNLSVNGAVTAKEFYRTRGWIAHHNADLWGLSNPVGDKGAGDPVWANWYMGGNWLCQHLYEHYRFTGDKKFLATRAYPVMKEAALFSLDWLIENKDGYLVTSPSTTPENKFKDKGGKGQGVSVATTMDMSIIRDLFVNVIESSEILNTDKNFRDSLKSKLGKLYPIKIGSKGQLQEWYKDFEETDPLHRHVSHLFALHPGREISVATPEFFNAAKKTLELRGDDGTGWSKAWKINFWARLQDGNHAYKLLRQIMQFTELGETGAKGGGTYPNFFDAHPPFQIDGNFGATAGVTEMLIQSQLNTISILPALPDLWKDGSISGLKARGNFQVDIEWENHRLKKAKIVAVNGGTCSITYRHPFKIKGSSQNSKVVGNTSQLVFWTEKGKTYELVRQ